MSLEWHQNFVSAQYLEKKWMEFDRILLMHWYWQHVAWDCQAPIFVNSLQSYGPWMMSEFRFCSISWVCINGFWPNFADALILTTSSLGLLSIHFRQFVTELQPLNDVRISFPLNIFRTNEWILTKYCICIDIDNIWLGIVKQAFSSIHYRVMALEWCQNFVSPQYLENEGMDCEQILHMHWYWQHLARDC